MAKAWDIEAYTYQAETLCPECVIEVMIAKGEASPAARDMDTEEVLGQIAEANGIDRMDERSYDSGDFPKVVFHSDIEDESCMRCGREL